MNDQQRFQLLFGSYRTPRFNYGATVFDEARGSVQITGLTDGPIPWPLGKPRGLRVKSTIILFSGLIKAVQRESNQAVAHWWGVSGQTVTKWRKALGVGPTTKGTSRLHSTYDYEEGVERGRRQAHKMSRDSVKDANRRAKIAAAKRWKKRPTHVIEAMRQTNLGRHLSKQTRQRMSKAHRRRGTRPAWLNSAWTSQEDRLLRTLPAEEVARRTGRSLSAVYSRRSKLRLPDGRKTRHAQKM